MNWRTVIGRRCVDSLSRSEAHGNGPKPRMAATPSACLVCPHVALRTRHGRLPAVNLTPRSPFVNPDSAHRSRRHRAPRHGQGIDRGAGWTARRQPPALLPERWRGVASGYQGRLLTVGKGVAACCISATHQAI